MSVFGLISLVSRVTSSTQLAGAEILNKKNLIKPETYRTSREYAESVNKFGKKITAPQQDFFLKLVYFI